MIKQPAVYIITNKKHGTLYTGVTSDLVGRIGQHKHKMADGFTKKYNLNKLVWYELHNEMNYAILREKQVKAGSRAKKLSLIQEKNDCWRDLYADIV